MIALRRSKLMPEPEREHERKQRRCLKCRKLFMSDWPGERICPQCKTKEDWRDGRSWLNRPNNPQPPK
jgi:hypothetical protein